MTVLLRNKKHPELVEGCGYIGYHLFERTVVIHKFVGANGQSPLLLRKLPANFKLAGSYFLIG